MVIILNLDFLEILIIWFNTNLLYSILSLSSDFFSSLPKLSLVSKYMMNE